MSRLYKCQLKKIIASLNGPGKQGKTKIKKSFSCLVVIGRPKEMNETNLAQHFTNNF